jgi:hypothetical protein
MSLARLKQDKFLSITNRLKRLNMSLVIIAEPDLPSIATPKSDYSGLRLHQVYPKVHWKLIAILTAKPMLMAPDPKDMVSAFLNLLAKLRIKIYEKIIHSIPAADRWTDTSTPSATTFQQIFIGKRVVASCDFDDYRGLILSSKQVYKEFENKWLRAFVSWLQDNSNSQRLILPAVRNISDLPHLRNGLQEQAAGWLHNATALHTPVALFVDNLPSFCIHPVTQHFPGLSPLTKHQISRVELGRKSRNNSRFLHAMELLAVAEFQANLHRTW